jgi:hypothetical protein
MPLTGWLINEHKCRDTYTDDHDIFEARHVVMGIR